MGKPFPKTINFPSLRNAKRLNLKTVKNTKRHFSNASLHLPPCNLNKGSQHESQLELMWGNARGMS